MVEAYEEQAKEQSLNVLCAVQLHDCSELVVDAGEGAGPQRSYEMAVDAGQTTDLLAS